MSVGQSAISRLSRKESGISLIELMVTLLISSFLILGIMQIYISNQRSYVFQQSQSGNQENARFAEFMLNEYLNKAGYRRAPDQAVEDAFPALAADADCQQFDAGSSVTATKNGDGVCIRYQPLTKNDRDCQGDTVKTFVDDSIFNPSPVSSLVRLAIRYQAGATLDTGVLQCKSINSTAAAYVELLRGIADFRLDFGLGNKDLTEKLLKDDSDANRFKTATSWAASDGPIRAVRYSILMASRENQRDSADSALLTNWLSNADATAKTRIENGDKRRIYQIASSTQNLRNLMP